MKRQRVKFKALALLLFFLFALLAAYGGYSVTRYGNRWFTSSKNPRVRTQKESVLAGDILDRTGALLATTDTDGSRIYPAGEDTRRAMVHLVGDSLGRVSNSVESFQTSYLYGFQASIGELFQALWQGGERRGDTVTLTAHAGLCTAMAEFFQHNTASAGKRGAMVVMNWRTGEVLGQVSLPGFDPMRVSEVSADDPGQPFWNRALQSVYPPGSTFKVVTAAAALTGLEDPAAFTFTCTEEPLEVGEGHTVSDFQGEAHGQVHLKEAFAESCNKTFATIALTVGQKGLQAAAERFGFNDNFLFRDLVVENSQFPRTAASDWTLAASGFGQSSVAASPMHMCMVAAGVANRGVMMEPRLLRRVVSAGGKERLGFSDARYTAAVEPETAALLRSYMRAVVTSGTGRRAAVDSMTICGKTGTADSSLDGKPITYGWFIGFNDEEQLPIALCVLVEGLDSKASGGTVAAPVAHDIFLWCREHREELVD